MKKQKQSHTQIIVCLKSQGRRFFDSVLGGSTVFVDDGVVERQVSGRMRLLSFKKKIIMLKYLGDLISTLKEVSLDVTQSLGSDVVEGLFGGVLKFKPEVQEYLSHLGDVGGSISASHFAAVSDSYVDVVCRRELVYTLCRGTHSRLGLYCSPAGGHADERQSRGARRRAAEQRDDRADE